MSQITFSYKDTSLIPDYEIQKIVSEMEEYTNVLRSVNQSKGYDQYEGSINLSFEEENLQKIKTLGDEYNGKVKYIIVIGIGGSNLGTMAIYNAIRKQFDLLSEQFPKIMFAETVSTSFSKDIINILDKVQNKEELLINIVSKSGGTTETISIFETLYDHLSRRFENVNDIVVTTTDEGSKLYLSAQEKGIKTLTIPEKVGGRFSVFSAVGLFPLYLAGIDIDRIASGARDLITRCLDQNDNISLLSAALIYIYRQKGIRINNNFFFNTELEYIGRWYRQLIGESIGKEYDVNGNIVHEGITPIVSIGSTDLHSMAQLYIGGPNDKLAQFIYHHEHNDIAKVPKNILMPGLVDSIEGKYFGDIMDAIINGVKRAYRNAQIPYTEVFMDSIDEYSVANYLQYKMLEMMYLGKLLGLNTFDQPNVEDYKKETRELLKQG